MLINAPIMTIIGSSGFQTTKPVRASSLAPVEQISRRSREHRPTIGALEAPHVTLCAFLEAAAGAAGRLGTEQRLSCVVDWQRPCQSPGGDRHLKCWADF
jgi:hypothetical protein